MPQTHLNVATPALLQKTAALGRPLFTLFSHPAPRVAHAAALLMRAVAEGGAEAAQPMREVALTGAAGGPAGGLAWPAVGWPAGITFSAIMTLQSNAFTAMRYPSCCAQRFSLRAEGAILQHLLSALSGQGDGHSALSRDLVALWADEYAPALALLKRVFPPGLIRYLNQRKQQSAAVTASPAAVATAAAAPPAHGTAAQQPAADGAAGRAVAAAQQQQQQPAQHPQAGEGQQGAASALAATQQLVAAASAAPGPSADPLQQLTQNGAQQQQQQQQQARVDASPLEPRYMSPPPNRPGKWCAGG